MTGKGKVIRKKNSWGFSRTESAERGERHLEELLKAVFVFGNRFRALQKREPVLWGGGKISEACQRGGVPSLENLLDLWIRESQEGIELGRAITKGGHGGLRAEKGKSHVREEKEHYRGRICAQGLKMKKQFQRGGNDLNNLTFRKTEGGNLKRRGKKTLPETQAQQRKPPKGGKREIRGETPFFGGFRRRGSRNRLGEYCPNLREKGGLLELLLKGESKRTQGGPQQRGWRTAEEGMIKKQDSCTGGNVYVK